MSKDIKTQKVGNCPFYNEFLCPPLCPNNYLPKAQRKGSLKNIKVPPAMQSKCHIESRRGTGLGPTSPIAGGG